MDRQVEEGRSDKEEAMGGENYQLAALSIDTITKTSPLAELLMVVSAYFLY